MRAKVFRCTVLLLAAFSICGAPKGQLVVTWRDSEIVVSGVTPRGEVALLVVMHSHDEYRGRVFHADERLIDDDGDGIVHLPIPADQSVISSAAVAIDERTGEYATAARDGDAPLMAASEFEVGRDKNGHTVELHLKAHNAHGVVVRPGRGSWGGAFEASGRRDDDGVYRPGLFIAASKLHRSGGTAPPDTLAPNDLFVVIDEQPVQVLIYREGGRP